MTGTETEMSEYVVLAQKFMNEADPESSIADWTVGTREQVMYYVKKWKDEGFFVSVRKCSHPLNIEFFGAGLNYKGEPV